MLGQDHVGFLRSAIFESELSYAEVNVHHQLKVDLVDEDGAKIFSMEGKFIAKSRPGHQPKPSDRVLHPNIISMQNIEFKKKGRHDVNIFLGTTLAHTLTFEVRPMSPPNSKAA